MTTINVYATLSEYKAHITAPGQTLSTDATDDAVVEDILEGASRWIDDQTGRTFYPRVETRNFDIPDSAETNDDRMLYFDSDLLEITTLTNGDDTAIAATEYKLQPYNFSPKYGLRLKDASGTTWESDSNGDSVAVLDVLGYWGYHNNYSQRAWAVGTTLAEALDTTETEWDVTSSSNFAAGQIVKVDNELGILSSTATGKLNVIARGDNGSTAATHDNAATVYIWKVQDDIRQACLEIAVNAYHRRFGQNMSGSSSITPQGVVISPKDVSDFAATTIRHYQGIF